MLDAELLEAIIGAPDPRQKAREVELKVARRLRGQLGYPRFRELSERLEALKERHERGQLHSLEFLKQLLELATELVHIEKDVPPIEVEDRGKAALTELFEEVRTTQTPVVVERIVADIDDIVRLVRFPGWQNTTAGEREVSTQQLGELVMRELKKLDKVAYVRFASVYRSFEDIDEFKTLVDEVRR